MANELRSEIFYQEDVLVTGSQACYMHYANTPGVLVLYESLEDNSKVLEWRPNDVTIDHSTDSQEDWAMVNTVTGRSRTISGDFGIRSSKSIKIDINEIKSFRISENSQKLTFRDGRGDIIAMFVLNVGNNDRLVSVLKRYLRTAPAKRDKHLFVVMNSCEDSEIQKLDKSFAELNLFTEQPSYWKSFQNHPYESAMTVFSKLSDIVYRNGTHRELDDDVKELIINSNSEQIHNISTNQQDDYEVVDYKLPKLNDYPRGQPLTKRQWTAMFDNRGRVEDVEGVKLIIFRGGVSEEIRPEVWKYLLGYYKWEHTNAVQLSKAAQRASQYQVMQLQWKTMSLIQEENFSDFRERKSLIIKDVERTDRNLDFYAGDDNQNIQKLYNILMTYAMYNFDLGYVQGMSDLLSPLLLILKDEVDAFWCFVGFMSRVKSYFEIDLAEVTEQLKHLFTLIKFMNPQFAKYLSEHDSENMFFCFRWVLVWFKRELSIEDTIRLWEVLWTGLPCKNFHLLIAVSLLLPEADTIMGNNYSFNEILKHTNELCAGVNLDDVINRAEGIFNQIIIAKHLTNNLRMILGLPIVDFEETLQVESSEESSAAEPLSNGKAQEDYYEAALSHSFL